MGNWFSDMDSLHNKKINIMAIVEVQYCNVYNLSSTMSLETSSKNLEPPRQGPTPPIEDVGSEVRPR